MFGLFKKKSSFTVRDTVWMNAAAQLRGAQRWLEETAGGSLVVWFREEQASLRKLLPESLHSRVLSTEFLSSAPGPLLFWNHYPLQVTETDLAERLGLREMEVYSALDSPFFQLFGGDNITGLMKKLGLKEEESISHSMISSSIRKAQDKLAARVGNELLAGSPEEWFRLNTGQS